MKSALRKELFELIATFAVLIVVLCAGWIGIARFYDVLWVPQGITRLVVLTTACVAGVYIAFVQYERERRRGTLGFLVHRGLGHHGVFVAKAIAGVIGVVIAGALPPWLYAVWTAITSPNGSVVHWQRVLELSVVAFGGVSVYALSVVVLQLRRGLVSGVILALSGCAAIIFLSLTWPSPVLAGQGSFIAFASLHAIASILLLMLGRTLFVRELDRDLALEPNEEARVAIAVMLLIVLPLSGWLGVYLAKTRLETVSDYPLVVRDTTSNEFFLVARDPGTWTTHRLGSDGALQTDVIRLEDDERWEVVCTPAIQVRRGIGRYYVFHFDSRWQQISVFHASLAYSPHEVARVDTFFDPDDGLVRVCCLIDESSSRYSSGLPQCSERAPFERSYARSDGKRFSERSEILLPTLSPAAGVLICGNSLLNDNVCCVADRQDNTLWMIDPLNRETPMRALELPDGDRVVGLEPLYARSPVREGRPVQLRTAWVVVGERGVYAWNSHAFVPYAPRDEHINRNVVRLGDAQRWRMFSVRGFDTDPIAPRAEIVDPENSSVLFTHQYEPRDRSERLDSALVQCGTLLRPPPINVVSFLRPDQLGELDGLWRPMLEEPLLFGRDRAGLWLCALALTTLQLAFVINRLRARRARVGSVWLWSTLVLLFGVLATAVFAMLEPGRARHAVDALITPDPARVVQAA